MSTYYIDRCKVATSLEDLSTYTYNVNDLIVNKTPEKIFFSPSSAFGAEDIFLNYGSSIDSSGDIKIFVGVNFLKSKDFDSYVKKVGSSQYFKAGKDAWNLMPSQYKTPRFVLENSKEFQKIQLEYFKRTGYPEPDVKLYMQNLFSDPDYQKFYEAFSGCVGGSGVRFLGDDSTKIADAITRANPGFIAKGLYKDLGVDLGGVDFVYFRKSATSLTEHATNNDPLNPTPLDWSGTSNPYQGKIEGSIGGSDKADYFVLKVAAGQRVTGITLSSYTSTDPKAFIGIQKGSQVTASSSNPGPLIGYTHFGKSQVDSDVGTNIINRLGGNLTEGTYSIWIQQLGAKTDYSFIVDLETVKNKSDSSTPTYNVSNTYAKNLVGDVLTGSPKLTQNSFDAKFYNLGEGRYGLQQKAKSTIDEITGVSTLSFNDKTVSISSDIKGVFDQVTGKETKDAQMYRLYNAAFARFPDTSGLRYWINEYTRGITDYRNIAQSFLNSEEFKTRYGANNSNTDFINNMYRNILGRLPDEEGRNYWVTNLDTGRDTRVNVLGGFAESTENKNLFSQVTGFT